MFTLQELAVRLQREEEERYERKKQQRALAKERKRLERLIHHSQMQGKVLLLTHRCLIQSDA